jgi:hypothetical protein
MYYMGFTWESFGLGPLTTPQRKWFVGRLNREIENSLKNKENNGDDGTPPTKAAHHNPSDVASMMGKLKPFNKNPRTNRLTT